MIGSLGTELIIILVLTIANGFFSGSEIAIVSARRSRLEPLADSGNQAARQAVELAEHPDRFLATVQVGITLIGTFAAAFGGARIGDVLAIWLRSIPALAPYAETIALTLVVMLITYLSLVVGELVPKRLALQNAEGIALFAAPIMNRLAWFAQPVIALLTFSVNLVMRLLGQRPSSEPGVTQEDIVYLATEGTTSGTVEAGEAQFIRRIFQFTDRPVRTAMTPRTEITAVSLNDPWAEVIETFRQSHYSRLPVYEGTLDQVVGVLHLKDVMPIIAEPSSSSTIRELMRQPTFVLTTHHVDDAMTLFRRHGAHLALVIDEYGQVAGLITLEDVLEELVGEIYDEYDQQEDSPFVRREDGSWLVDAMQAYDRVRDRIGLPADINEESVTTLAGLIIAHLDRLPKVGDTITLGSHVLEVIDMDGRRIDKVLIRERTDTQQTYS